ncbi:hypothetical protein L7F22_002712 [Adiantum nelumboides]|nr:hypothetical protein [Adiantum nelumboides]
MSFGDGSQGALGQSGSVTSDAYEPLPVDVLPNNVIRVAAGHYHSLAVTADGQLWSWGRNNEGQLGRGTALSRMDGYREEGSSSQDRPPIPTVHEIGESSGQAEKALQIVTAVTMFKQLMENPRFMEFIQSSSMAHQVQGGFGMPGTVFRGMQDMVPNPMYANIGLHPGFQGTQGQFGVSQGNLGMAGFSIPPMNMTPRHQHVTGKGVQMAPTDVSIMQIVSFDNLESMDKSKPYKEGGQSVQLDTFNGFDERTKAFFCLEQFDKAFTGRNFQKPPKLGKLPLF